MIRKWIEQGLEQGRERGLVEGSELGQIQLLTKQLTKRFGTLPTQIQQKIRSSHPPQLEEWALRLIDASSLDEATTRRN